MNKLTKLALVVGFFFCLRGLGQSADYYNTSSTGVLVSSDTTFCLSYVVAQSTTLIAGFSDYFLLVDTYPLAAQIPQGYPSPVSFPQSQWIIPPTSYDVLLASNTPSVSGMKQVYDFSRSPILIKNGLTITQSATGHSVSVYTEPCSERHNESWRSR